MKICVAQTRPIKGDIQRNIEQHTRLIDLAIVNGAHTVIFPELSLTGYEPTLANTLATDPGDRRFDDFQRISDGKQITIGVGMPIRTGAGICIGMVLFQPFKPRRTYFKKYLHRDEEVFFVSGDGFRVVLIDETTIAFAICYELSVDEHSADASKSGAQVYIASVAKTERGTDDAIRRLANIAQRYSMTVLMSNCVGQSEDGECVGKSSIWDKQGLLVGQLDDENEGVLLIDIDTGQLAEAVCSSRSLGMKEHALKSLARLPARHDFGIWQEVAQLIGRGGGYRWVGLYEVTDTEIRAVAWTGSVSPALPKFPRDRGLNGVAVTTKAPVVCQDVTHDARYLTAFASTGSEAICPVLSEVGEVIGTIDVESDRRNAFSADDERFLRACAATLRTLWESAPHQKR